jgi:hypothetical protein
MSHHHHHGSRCEIELPGRPAAVEVARHFAVVAFRLWDMDEFTVEDARLAVSELATAAVVGGADRFSVVCELVDGRVTVDVSPVAAAGMLDGPVDRRDVVETLFPGSSLEGNRYRLVIEA